MGEHAFRVAAEWAEALQAAAASGRVWHHGKPPSDGLSLTIMFDVDVEADSATAAVQLMSSLLEHVMRDSSGLGAGAERALPAGLSPPGQRSQAPRPGRHPWGPPLPGGFFFRSLGIPGMRELWGAEGGGEQPFAFLHPDILRVTAAWHHLRTSGAGLSAAARRRLKAACSPAAVKAALRTAGLHLASMRLSPGERAELERRFGRTLIKSAPFAQVAGLLLDAARGLQPALGEMGLALCHMDMTARHLTPLVREFLRLLMSQQLQVQPPSSHPAAQRVDALAAAAGASSVLGRACGLAPTLCLEQCLICPTTTPVQAVHKQAALGGLRMRARSSCEL